MKNAPVKNSLTSISGRPISCSLHSLKKESPTKIILHFNEKEGIPLKNDSQKLENQ